MEAKSLAVALGTKPLPRQQKPQGEMRVEKLEIKLPPDIQKQINQLQGSIDSLIAYKTQNPNDADVTRKLTELQQKKILLTRLGTSGILDKTRITRDDLKKFITDLFGRIFTPRGKEE